MSAGTRALLRRNCAELLVIFPPVSFCCSELGSISPTSCLGGSPCGVLPNPQGYASACIMGRNPSPSGKHWNRQPPDAPLGHYPFARTTLKHLGPPTSRFTPENLSSCESVFGAPLVYVIVPRMRA